MSGQKDGAGARGKSNGASKLEPRNYFITGRDVCVVKTKQLIEAMKPTAPEELGSTSFIEKMESTGMICRALATDPGRYLDHLIKHEKHKVLVHEMVLISLWCEEILPRLFSNSKGLFCCPDCCGCGGREGIMVFFTTTPAAFMTYQILCSTGVTVVLEKLDGDGARSLGMAIMDVIDLSVRACRDFIARDRESCPGTVGLFSKSSTGQLQPSIFTSGELALWSLANLSLLVSHLESLPQNVLAKLIHPDTQFMPTLLDLIEHKPWNSIITKAAKKAAKAGSGSSCSCKNCCAKKHAYFASMGMVFQTMESKVLEIIAKYSDVLSKAFPKDVAASYLMPRECSSDSSPFMEVLDKCLASIGRGDLMHLLKKPQMDPEIQTSFGDREALSGTLEPSPYDVEIRAELAERREAIIKIHGAMNSFEVMSVEKAKNRLSRDFAFLREMRKQKFCSKCKKPEVRLRCSRCHVAYYCNRKCQSKHWASHKLTCQQEQSEGKGERGKHQFRDTESKSPSAWEMVEYMMNVHIPDPNH